MDIVQGEPGSSDESCGTCMHDGSKVTSVEAERVSHMTDNDDHEPATIPTIKTEPNVSCMHVVSVTHISYSIYEDLGAPMSVCPCETKT